MYRVKLKSPEEIEIMRKGGAISAKILNELVSFADEGMATLELDKKAEDLCKIYRVKSGTIGYMGYPAHVSVSINDELVHGIPSKNRTIEFGDVVSIDLVIVYEGYFLDHAKTIILGDVDESVRRLVGVTEFATYESIKQARVGNRIGNISSTMQSIVELSGFNVSRQMIGHGIGKQMHEEPEIPCFGIPNSGIQIQNGMTLAVETMSMTGDYELEIDAEDGWTARTEDGSITAHFEHTIAVQNGKSMILTIE